MFPRAPRFGRGLDLRLGYGLVAGHLCLSLVGKKPSPAMVVAMVVDVGFRLGFLGSETLGWELPRFRVLGKCFGDLFRKAVPIGVDRGIRNSTTGEGKLVRVRDHFRGSPGKENFRIGILESYGIAGRKSKDAARAFAVSQSPGDKNVVVSILPVAVLPKILSKLGLFAPFPGRLVFDH